MKLTVFIIIIFTSVLFASETYSQVAKVNISVKSSPFGRILSEIEQQTNYLFVYDKSDIDMSREISLEANNKTVADVLSSVFDHTDIVYAMEGNNIMLMKKEEMDRFEFEAITQQQKRTISGTVVDEYGEPVSGANVTVKGTTIGITTDMGGKFTLGIPDHAVLSISYIGYVPQEINTDGKQVIDIILKENAKLLEEIVVIGYGYVKKSDLTGSVSSVKSEELNAYPATNVMQALSGRSSGVIVSQNTGAPGGSISVRVRGANSIRGDNEPLYVIDGFPITGAPTNLNNADIESVEILKDASATAIYGSRGANGVVMITTKQGKVGKTSVEFNAGYSIQSRIKKLDLMDATEYARFYNIQQKNDTGKEFFTQEEINGFGRGYDYQDLIFRSAPIYTAGLTVSGGNNKTQFSIGGNLYQQEGIIKGSGYDRYSVRTNINHKISNQFSISLNSTLSHLKRNARDSGQGARGNSMISAAISAPPTLDPYNENGTYRALATVYPFVATDLINPLNFINEQKNEVRANIVLANAALIYNPIPELTIKVMGGVDNRDDTNGSYTTRNYINSPGRASRSANQRTSLLNENTISYMKTFCVKHSVSALAGFTYQDFLNTGLSGSGNGFLSDIFEEYSLGSSMTPNPPGSSYSKTVLLSYLGRVNYSYDDKYLITASIRRDGSSKYSKGNKWGYFPSAAVAWKMSNEDFLKDNEIISSMKLRASWGKTGSQAINAYATLSTLSAGRTIFNDALFNTFAPGTTLPGDLKWETTMQTDIGLDVSILNNRVSLAADYYIKKTSDLLNIVKLPTSMGYNSTIKNVGEVQNKGFDFNVDSHILTGEFNWNINANISFNRNKVLKLYGGEDILGGDVNVVVISDNTSILREGMPIGQFWGYLEDGYNDKGNIVFKDLDKNGSITQDDKTCIGDPNPDFTYGFNSMMSYKDFELSLFFQGVQGNDIFNASAIVNTIDYGFGLNMPKEVLYNHWTPENPNAKYPAISYNTTARVSDRFIEDGSYLRLKNIQLGYNIPVNRFNKSLVNSIQLYVSGQNLLTFTKYSWWDPEVNSRGSGNSTALGIDHNAYPSSKSFTFGIRAVF
ncbi:MAG: TonB-dependent receptor [Tannerella sp.]|nr:TonB-dependent receptor [Tannerella sp.]